jgi:hypothetical protein
MPKVKGPLFSLQASGTFKDALEFRTVNGQAIVGGTKGKTPPRTPAQQAQSQRFKTAVAAWQVLDESGKALWRTAAVGTGMNGYQLYLSEYQTQNIVTPGQPAIP